MNYSYSKNDVQIKQVVPFFMLCFIISWTLIGMYILFPKFATESFGKLGTGHPFFFMAVYAPAIAAIALVLIHSGISGLIRFIKRLKVSRLPLKWWIFIIFGVPLTFFIGSVIKGNADTTFVYDTSIVAIINSMIFMMFLGPVEEFGWRGFALPLLQRKFSPFTASVIIGTLWGFWHLPVFLLSNMMQSEWSFLPFLLGNISLSIIMTAIFNTSKGSIFIAIIFHYQLINPLWPDAQPYDTLCFSLIAMAILYLNKNEMFNNDHAYKNVLIQEQ